MILDNIKLPVSYTKEDLEASVKKALGKRKVKIHSLRLLRRSIDARKKPDVFYVCKVAVNEPAEKMHIPEIEKPLKVVVAGSGPCGLFAALILSLSGASVTVLERGDDADTRKKKTEHFFATGELDTESNIQFGEGGAGTFSDGKLNTLIKDSQHYGAFVLQTFYECGAPEEILYDAKPHIGTDILPEVVKNLRKKLVDSGASVLFRHCLTDILIEDGSFKAVEVNHEMILPCDRLILATGHSARDTFQMLYDRGFTMEKKPFAVGIRMEHSQEMITLSQYGTLDYEELGAAPYKLSYQAKNGRGVYSFCMCPGGYVVNASSEEGGLAVNGMSYHARDSKNANAGIVVQVFPEDFHSDHPLSGIELQRSLERKAFEAGRGQIPVQLYEDFLKGQVSDTFGSVTPEMKGYYRFSDLNGIFPEEVLEALKEAISAFGKKINGFDRGDSVLSAVESRTSSPVRVLRDESHESNIKGVCPAGEGAGYAGGIMSAAIDGIRTALKIIEGAERDR